MIELDRAYDGRSVVVTGGASFIGSHLVDRLLELGADVVVVDDFSSGKRENVETLPDDRILELDLSDRARTLSELPAAEIVFHLAAVHGGRGFIDTYPDQVLVNLAIDNNVLTAAANASTRRVVHASSACVYPVTLQAEATSRSLLKEAQAGFDTPGLAFPDGAYGWAKLMGEYQLREFHKQGRVRGTSARIFTAYGERENESHAAIALIAKAVLRMDPYPIWGDGRQTRNFTYVADTVQGLLLLGALDNPTFVAANVGTSTHHTVLELVETIFELCGWRPSALDLQTSRPVGVASRASDNELVRRLFGWEPHISVREGISRSLAWYESRVDRPRTADELDRLLLSR